MSTIWSFPREEEQGGPEKALRVLFQRTSAIPQSSSLFFSRPETSRPLLSIKQEILSTREGRRAVIIAWILLRRRLNLGSAIFAGLNRFRLRSVSCRLVSDIHA